MCERTTFLKLVALNVLVAVALIDTADAQMMNNDGSRPAASVAVSGSAVFGTATRGGANGDGTFWSFDTSSGMFAKLYDFSEAADGSAPSDVAVSGTTVFGTAESGGMNKDGTIWSFDTSSDTFNKLHDFSRDIDGAGPVGVAVSGPMVFGTASTGGENGDGTIWSFDTTSGTFTKLHDFNHVPDGSDPLREVAVSGSMLFGTASRGGANDDGTFWSFDTSTDTFTKLHDFTDVADGRSPVGGVAVSGTTVFGTSWQGGANDDGTLWSFATSSDTFTSLHHFDRGATVGNLAISNGTVFGSAWEGGANDDGTLWSFDTNTDTFTKLHDFSRDADGGHPFGGVELSGSTVFGTANRGGAKGDGTIWSFDTGTNTFTNLYSFNVPEPSLATLAAVSCLAMLIFRMRRRS